MFDDSKQNNLFTVNNIFDDCNQTNLFTVNNKVVYSKQLCLFTVNAVLTWCNRRMAVKTATGEMQQWALLAMVL